ncbi:MAG: hypothetical protein ACJATI_004865 [Halioglobus sp.]
MSILLFEACLLKIVIFGTLDLKMALACLGFRKILIQKALKTGWSLEFFDSFLFQERNECQSWRTTISIKEQIFE